MRASYPQVWRLLRFILVGFATAGLYALIIAVILRFGIVGPTSATGLAYMVSITFNYWMHHRFTFATDRPYRSSLLRYSAITALTFVAVTAATALLPDVLHMNFVWIQSAVFLLAAIAGFILQSTYAFSKLDIDNSIIRVEQETEAKPLTGD